MATLVTTIEQAQDLAEGLLNTRRAKPWCVISTPNDDTNPVFDVASIEDDVASVSEVFVIWGGPATRVLQELLPPDTHVFGGAARVYPISFAATKGATAGKLRYVYPPGTVTQSTQRLNSDIWAAAMDAGLLAQATADAIATTGVVKQFYGDSVALLQLENGELVSIRQEATFPGVPLTWIFEIGQQVAGKFDRETRIFTLENQNFSAADAVAHFGLDTVTLGLIKDTDRKNAVIAIHPNLSFEVSKAEITGNPFDVISEYLRVGEVWPVRIYRDPQGKIRLKMNDIDDDEPIAEAVSLIDGGTPWLDQSRYVDLDDDLIEVNELITSEALVLDESEFEEPELPAASAGASPVAASSKDKETRLHEQAIAHYRAQIITGNRVIERLNNELNQLAGSYRELNLAVQRYKEEASTYKQIVADSRKAKTNESRAGSGAYARRDRFESLDEWFNEELRRTWLGLYAPSDRIRYALNEGNWAFGTEFFDGLNPRDLDETELRKLLRVVVHLVTGRNGVERIAESHELRVNNKPLMRGNDVGLRMHIENGQPQAKRLHYFKLAAGGYELTQVGNHDDYLD